MNAPEFRLGGVRPVGRLGLGAMRLPTDGPDRAASITLLRRAVELGITLIDTAFMYGWGANEELIADALHPYPAEVLIATKVGIGGTSFETWRNDGRPESLCAQVDVALRRLRRDRLELVQLHRLDPDVPLADQVGMLRELRDAGKLNLIGLSEVSVSELTQARAVVEVASVQNRYSVLDREHEAVLNACTDAGIAFLPWRPLAPPELRRHATLAAVAAEVGASTAQVSLAWLLHRSPIVLPIPGTADPAHLEENLAAAGLHLSADQLARLDAAQSG